MTTTQNHRPTTPGFNCHLHVRFTADRNGRRLAYRWSQLGFRWLRMPLADAEMFVAQGLATKVNG